MSRKQILKHLNTKDFEWELSDDKSHVVFMDCSEYGHEIECDLILNSELFETEIYDLPRYTSDPTEVSLVGKFTICSDYNDTPVTEWFDKSDVADVFFNNIDKIQIKKI